MRAAGIPQSPPRVPLSSTAAYVRSHVLPAALQLLPARLDSPPARALIIAIGLQESRFEHRRQAGGGPARGFWQFERGGGTRGVLEHEASKPLARAVLTTLRYEPGECFDALAHNDVLACAFARLLLWTHPSALPTSAAGAWAYYLDTWRPGRPRPQTWQANYALALAAEA